MDGVNRRRFLGSILTAIAGVKVAPAVRYSHKTYGLGFQVPMANLDSGSVLTLQAIKDALAIFERQRLGIGTPITVESYAVVPERFAQELFNACGHSLTPRAGESPARSRRRAPPGAPASSAPA